MRSRILPGDDGPAACRELAHGLIEQAGCISYTEEPNSVIRGLRRVGFHSTGPSGLGMLGSPCINQSDTTRTACGPARGHCFSSDERGSTPAFNPVPSSSVAHGGDPTFHPAGSASEVQQALSSVRNAEESFRKAGEILDHLPVPALAIDRDGTLVAWNRAVEEMTGVRADGLLGKGGYEYAVPFYGTRRPLLLDFVIRPEDERLLSLYTLLTSGKGLLVGESRARFGDGRECSLMIHAKSWFDSSGNLIGAIETVHDVSGPAQNSQEVTHIHDVLRDRNKELERYSQELTRANRTLGLMNTITRHDILNQLTIVNGYLALILELTTNPFVVGYLEKSREAIRVIDKQIEFTRQYHELGACRPEWQNVGNVFAQAVSQFPTIAITFHFKSVDLEVYADRLLVKIFYNLIDNSRRHGMGVREIKVYTRRNRDTLILVYEDDGKGIPPYEKEQIFSRNYGKNTGLGLFLVREILQITGITITETGVEGKGARFEIRIPEGSFRSVE